MKVCMWSLTMYREVVLAKVISTWTPRFPSRTLLPAAITAPGEQHTLSMCNVNQNMSHQSSPYLNAPLSTYDAQVPIVAVERGQHGFSERFMQLCKLWCTACSVTFLSEPATCFCCSLYYCSSTCAFMCHGRWWLNRRFPVCPFLEHIWKVLRSACWEHATRPAATEMLWPSHLSFTLWVTQVLTIFSYFCFQHTSFKNRLYMCCERNQFLLLWLIRICQCTQNVLFFHIRFHHKLKSGTANCDIVSCVLCLLVDFQLCCLSSCLTGSRWTQRFKGQQRREGNKDRETAQFVLKYSIQGICSRTICLCCLLNYLDIPLSSCLLSFAVPAGRGWFSRGQGGDGGKGGCWGQWSTRVSRWRWTWRSQRPVGSPGGGWTYWYSWREGTEQIIADQ